MISPKHFASASFYNLIYLVTNSLVFLVLTPLTLKELGSDVYGVWTVLLSVMQIAGLLNIGIGSALEKFVAQYLAADQTEGLSVAVTFSLMFSGLAGTLVCFLLWIGRELIAGQLHPQSIDFPILVQTVGLISLAIIPQFLSQAARGIFLGFVQNSWAGFFDTLQASGLSIGVFLIAVFRGQLYHFAWFTLVLNWAILGGAFCILSKVLHQHHLQPKLETRIILPLLRQSVMVWLSSIGVSLFQSADRILVGFFVSPGAAGVYSIATSVALRIVILLGQFTQVLTPLASQMSTKGLVREVRMIYEKMSRFSGWFVYFVSGFLLIWMGEILKVWMSPDFSRSYTSIFQVLILIYSLHSMVRPAFSILVGLGQVKTPSIILLVAGLSTIAAIWLGCIRFGLLGAVWGNMIYCMVLFLNYYLAKRYHMPLKFLLTGFGVPMVLLISIFGLTMSVSGHFMQSIGLSLLWAFPLLLLAGKNRQNIRFWERLYDYK